MITSSNSLFDTALLGQSPSFRGQFSTLAKAASKSKASAVPDAPASLWRHTLNEYEAARGHGLVMRSVYGVLGVMSIGSVAVAAWQMHSLFSGNCLQDAISMILH